MEDYPKVRNYLSKRRTKSGVSWRDKASQIIAELSYTAWYHANHSKAGKRYKAHRPYTIPELAEELVACLAENDLERAELRAKQIFNYEL